MGQRLTRRLRVLLFESMFRQVRLAVLLPVRLSSALKVVEYFQPLGWSYCNVYRIRSGTFLK